jgi:preprotein translocase subunit YajC
MKKNYLFVILVLIIFAGVFWYLTKASNSKPSEQDNSQTEVVRTSQKEETKTQINGKIVYVAKQNNFTINTYNFTDKKIETLFTDKNEAFKVKAIAGQLTNNRIALFTEGDQNKILAVSLDGIAKTEVLFDNIGNPDLAAVSPDGKNLAFVFFSNVERDYGYNLYLRTNDNKEEALVRSDDAITNLVWNGNATKLLYLDKSSPKEIRAYDFALRKSVSFSDFENEVFAFNFANGDLFASLIKNSDSVIMKINSEGSGMSEIATITKTKAFDIFIEEANMAFLSSAGSEPVSSGKIKIDNKDGIINSEEANNIIGWLKN